ncbi:NHLP-related RiPP peptide [Massilia sp. TS11]|uniref:NHLP-related RiPP peptide n=1 Tax=Massilia sp. TS11 TaxID=2908003 RepID=UPI001EDAD727|nr:NHLP-related RiPP peptide [Massilia sp. TS11]MCG2584857.1 NHLP-related RiPP peptide [Massilia sp. TS11]
MATPHNLPAIETLLDKLATDDAFRDQLSADPLGTLASIGLTPDPSEVPATPTLPPKHVVAANRATLHAALTAGNEDFIYFFLDQPV